MAEIVSSAIAQETVSQILSGLVKRYENKDNSHKNEDLERLEMAHIKLEAALEASDKWQITDASLLRWRKKLKRAAKECDGTLHRCKQRIIEEEQMKKAVRESSFPKRIAHTTRSFVFSIFNHNNDESTRSSVRRFEWYADGASDFLRFLDLGGTPRCYMPFDPLTMHLLKGKKLEHSIVRVNECPLFLLWTPFTTAEYGIEASLIFLRRDANAPENCFLLCIMLQLSESTDIVGIAIKCLQLFAPLFKSTIETITNELMQLPTRDFSWVPYVDSDQKKHWDNLHSFGTQWFRPNPLCCKQHDQHDLRSSSMGHMSQLPDSSLEPVIGVNLQCRVSPSEYNQWRTASKGSISLRNPAQLKAGLLFMPHGSSEDLVPANESSATQVVNGGEQRRLLTNISLQQLEEIVLPKAIDYFLQNAEASVYQILWKSKHGSAYFQVMNTSMKNNQSRRRMIRGARKGKLRIENQNLERQTHVAPHYFDLMVAHAPVRMQGSIMDWIQKERVNQLAPPPLCRQF
ncbi:hypothetical protein EJB05_14152, partial [Eragrostis curvula]